MTPLGCPIRNCSFFATLVLLVGGTAHMNRNVLWIDEYHSWQLASFQYISMAYFYPTAHPYYPIAHPYYPLLHTFSRWTCYSGTTMTFFGYMQCWSLLIVSDLAVHLLYLLSHLLIHLHTLYLYLHIFILYYQCFMCRKDWPHEQEYTYCELMNSILDSEHQNNDYNHLFEVWLYTMTVYSLV